MANLMVTRAHLDAYLTPIGYKPETNRLFVLKRLIQLQREDFLAVLNTNEDELKKFQPSNIEILLQAFVEYLHDCDKYYSRSPASRSEFFLGGFLPQPSRFEKTLQLEIRPKEILCHIASASVPFLKNISGLFALVTFITAFVQMKHAAELENVPECSFKYLIERFDVSN